MKCLTLTLLLFVLSTKAWACSCFGIASIDKVIARSPILVEGQVVARKEVNSKEYGLQVHSVTLQIKKQLKGNISTKNIVVYHTMCYVSLYLELMKVGHVYVLPLELMEAGNIDTFRPDSPEYEQYQLAMCAHSGMEFIDGKLYTFEHSEKGNGLERELKFYKEYINFQREFQRSPSK